MPLLHCILFSTTLPLLVFSLPATPSNSSTPSIPTSETASPSGGSPFSTSAPSSWQHPGFVISTPQLDFVKSQLSGKAQPWTDAYNKMLGDKDKYGAYVSATRSSKARATVECGPVTNPDIGCTDERGDALAAWSNALAGYLTGNEEYTKNAILYMNKWSTVVKSHTNANAVLQTAWSGASWARAGELVRHTTTGLWEDADITSFENMLRNVYLPACKDGTVKAPNWDLACLNTAVGIAVFLEDKEEYEHAMDVFQKAVPTIIYMEADGNLPLAREGESRDKKTLQGAWYNQQTWGNSGQSGQVAETCRDLTHTGYSISSISHILETSRIQGSDQYNTDIGDRLKASLEFHTGLADSSSAPSWLCSGKPSRVLEYVTEIGYNAFVTRGGASMPQTEKYTEKERPQGTNGLFYGWETLTHAGNKA